MVVSGVYSYAQELLATCLMVSASMPVAEVEVCMHNRELQECYTSRISSLILDRLRFVTLYFQEGARPFCCGLGLLVYVCALVFYGSQK